MANKPPKQNVPKFPPFPEKCHVCAHFAGYVFPGIAGGVRKPLGVRLAGVGLKPQCRQQRAASRTGTACLTAHDSANYRSTRESRPRIGNGRPGRGTQKPHPANARRENGISLRRVLGLTACETLRRVLGLTAYETATRDFGCTRTIHVFDDFSAPCGPFETIGSSSRSSKMDLTNCDHDLDGFGNRFEYERFIDLHWAMLVLPHAKTKRSQNITESE